MRLVPTQEECRCAMHISFIFAGVAAEQSRAPKAVPPPQNWDGGTG